jgi:hypothetical protein
MNYRHRFDELGVFHVHLDDRELRFLGGAGVMFLAPGVVALVARHMDARGELVSNHSFADELLAAVNELCPDLPPLELTAEEQEKALRDAAALAAAFEPYGDVRRVLPTEK